VLAEIISLDGEGYVQIPQKPGLGVEISEEAVERMAVGFSGSAEVLRLGGRAVD
jgi:hypothetical protein